MFGPRWKKLPCWKKVSTFVSGNLKNRTWAKWDHFRHRLQGMHVTRATISTLLPLLPLRPLRPMPCLPRLPLRPVRLLLPPFRAQRHMARDETAWLLQRLYPVMETRAMRRLIAVKQLGFAYLRWPAATHSRYEHSCGAASLAVRYAEALRMPSSYREPFAKAALLHDIGHGPFSHAFEACGFDHDKQRFRLLREDQELADAVGSCADDVMCIWDPARSGAAGWHAICNTLLAGAAGVDRIDWVTRDMGRIGPHDLDGRGTPYDWHTQSAAAIDRIMAATSVPSWDHQRVCFSSTGERAILALLSARLLLHRTVYTHAVPVRATAKLRYCLQHGLGEALARVPFHTLTDAMVLRHTADPALPGDVRRILSDLLHGRVTPGTGQVTHRVEALPRSEADVARISLRDGTHLFAGVSPFPDFVHTVFNC